MIIDTHCHIWSYDHVPYYNNLPLVDYLLELGIDKISLICMNNQENALMKHLVEANPESLFGIAYVDFNNMAESLRALRVGYAKGYIKGVKLYPYFEHFQVDDKQIYPFYETAVELELPVIPHLGWVYMDIDTSNGNKGHYSDTGFPVQYANVMEDFPDLKLVITHLGGNYYYEFLTMAERFESMMMETAWLPDYCKRMYPSRNVKGWIEHAVSILGAKRLMYAGEGVFPQDILQTNLSMQEKSDILGHNALKFFNLSHKIRSTSQLKSQESTF